MRRCFIYLYPSAVIVFDSRHEIPETTLREVEDSKVKEQLVQHDNAEAI